MKNLSRKGFVHTSGKIIEIPFDPKVDLLPEDHSVFAVQNPHLFDSTHEEMKNAAGEKDYEKLKRGSLAWSQGVQNLLNKKGFMRFTKSVENKYKGGKEHIVTITTESQMAEPEHFIEPLKAIKQHAEKLPEEDSFVINMSGFKNLKQKDKFLEDRNLKKTAKEGIIVSDMNSLNKYIGEEGGKVRRDPIQEPKGPSQMEIQRALGQKPSGMSQAEWNFYTRTESTENPMKFSVLLEKIKENKLLKRVAMRNYVPPHSYGENLKPEDRLKTDPKTEEKISDISGLRVARVKAQARRTWEKNFKERSAKNKEVQRVSDIMLGPEEEKLDRYDLIMKLAKQKSKAAKREAKVYGYEEKPKNYGQETMSAIASTFARRSGRTLPPTGSAHY
jgi:hypothetical protein